MAVTGDDLDNISNVNKNGRYNMLSNLYYPNCIVQLEDSQQLVPPCRRYTQRSVFYMHEADAPIKHRTQVI